MATLQSIRQKIIDRQYLLSSHAIDEMRADGLNREDVEKAILSGKIDKKLSGDPRGARHRIVGRSLDGRSVSVICRIRSDRNLVIITVYATS
jgi:hypothetical protein